MHNLRQFKAGDLTSMVNNLRPYDKKLVEFFGVEKVDASHVNPLSYTLGKNGICLGAAGVHSYWPGVAEVWMYSTTEFESHYFTALKLMKKMLAHIVEKEGIWRLQTTISADLQMNQDFIKWLGFKAEHIMHKFGPFRDDYIMFSKVTD